MPSPPTDASFHNRFIGSYVLYGTGQRWAYEQQEPDPHLYVANTKTGAVTTLVLAHGVDRLEATGGAALVVGEAGEDLHFTDVSLTAIDHPTVTRHVVLRHLTQGETRSQGFFYRPDDRYSEEGVIALPVRRPAAPVYASLFDESAAVVFVRKNSSHLYEIGRLVAHDQAARDDDCKASCVDWYGNSRPIFIKKRILALMGYEIIEGAVEDGRIYEVNRASFAPKTNGTRKQ